MASNHGATLPRVHVILALTILSRSCLLVSSECDSEQLSRFPGGWPKALDVGVYWFGPGDATEKATGVQSRFYDPSKPTIIFVHGWTGYGLKGGVQHCRRWSSQCAICEDKRLLSKPWLEKGWNWGIFYWDQFSDEACLRDAELKVWVNPQKPEGLAWKSFDIATKKVAVMHYDPAMPSMGHLCAQLVEQAMGDFRGETFRIVGHSLGAQLAAHCAQLLHQRRPNSPAAPSRVVLLDPVYTGEMQHFGQIMRKSFPPTLQRYLFHCLPINNTEWIANKSFGEWIAKNKTLEAISMLWQMGFPTELYKGSLLSMTKIIGDPAKELETVAAYVVQDVDGGYCHHDSLNCGHSSLVPLYMLRIADPQPPVQDGEPVGNCMMPGPLCTDAQIRGFVQTNNALIAATGERHVWHQVNGILTVGTTDDTYRMQSDPVPTQTTLARVLANLPAKTKRELGVYNKVQASDSSSQSRLRQSTESKSNGQWGLAIVILLLISLCCMGLLCRALRKRKTTSKSDLSCFDDDREDKWEELVLSDQDAEAPHE